MLQLKFEIDKADRFTCLFCPCLWFFLWIFKAPCSSFKGRFMRNYSEGTEWNERSIRIKPFFPICWNCQGHAVTRNCSIFRHAWWSINSMRLSKNKPIKYSTSILRRSRRIECFTLRNNCKIPLSNTINISVINVHSRKPCINILSLFFLIMHYRLLTWIELFGYYLWSSHLLFPSQ